MPLLFEKEIIGSMVSRFDMARNVVLLSHTNPDGDAIGSSLAFCHWVKTNLDCCGRLNIQIVLPHPILEDAQYLPSSSTIKNMVEGLEECRKLICNADTIVCLDFNRADRIGCLADVLAQSKAFKLLFDHHHNPDSGLFDILFSVPDISSTCELLYWVFVQACGESSINDDIAQCLYHGMMTDTGSFSYSCEDPSLYEAVAGLMKHPIDAAQVHNRLFNNYSVEKMRVLAFLLHDRLKIFESHGFAYMYISEADLTAVGGQPSDLEGLVNYTLMLQNVEVGAMVKEAEGKVRLSFRSKKHFDVNMFASKYFGGGGHTKASGATSPYDFQTTLDVLEHNMLNELDESAS